MTFVNPKVIRAFPSLLQSFVDGDPVWHVQRPEDNGASIALIKIEGVLLRMMD